MYVFSNSVIIVVLKGNSIALFFNLKTLEEQAGNNNQKFLTLLEHHYNKKTIPSKWDKYPPSKVHLHGYSYLLNPRDFFLDKNTDILYRVQYIKLAALRDWLLYKQYKYKALQTSFFPDLNWDAISHNPLFKITPSEVLLKYEELV